MRRRRATAIRRCGSSLIEVFLAATIVAVGFIGVAGALSYAAKVSRLANDTMVAEQLAADQLARARLVEPPLELTSWYTYPAEPNTSGAEYDCNVALSQSGLAQAETWFTVTDVSGGLKGVSVVVCWGTGTPKGRVETQALVSARF